MSRLEAAWARIGVNIFNFFRSPKARTADSAKDRLQVLLALERRGEASKQLSFLPDLQNDLIAVIGKYVEIDNDKVTIDVERGTEVSLLGINVELPTPAEKAPRKRAKVRRNPPVTPQSAAATS